MQLTSPRQRQLARHDEPYHACLHEKKPAEVCTACSPELPTHNNLLFVFVAGFDDLFPTPWPAGSRVWSRREEKWALEEKEMEVAAEEERKNTQERQREMQRRMNPTTVQDFEVKSDRRSTWDA